MNEDQKKELATFHAVVSDEGNRLNTGSIPWLLDEVTENIDRMSDLLSPAHDRVSKRTLKPILKDIRDQIRELKRRLS
jgi:hypothetical protein